MDPRKHRHTWTDPWGTGSGTAPPRCAKMARGKPCDFTGAHITTRCACGATRVTCRTGGTRITYPEVT